MRGGDWLRYAVLTDTGMRERNEDACFASLLNGYHVFGIADGLGGHACGDVASRMAIEILEETASEELSAIDPAEVLKHAFRRINTAIFAFNQERGLNAGTTLSVAIAGESGRCWIGTVGDSRTYIITSSSVWHTHDHTYVQSLVDAGIISPAEAIYHPAKNILARALGLEAGVEVDLDEMELSPGSVLLLSSDGLHDYVPAEVIQRIVMANDPEVACRKLIDAARDAGSTDNTTVIVAKPR